MRWALMLAAAGVTGKFAGSPGQLLQRGRHLLGSSSELGSAAGGLPGRLFDAGKAAAAATASSGIDSLTDRLHRRTESLRRPGASKDGYAEDDDGYEEDVSTGKRGRGADPTTDAPAEDEFDDDLDEEESASSGGRAGSRRGRAKRVPERSDSARSRSVRSDDEPEGDDAQPVATRRPAARSRSDQSRSPVRRVRG
jgi:hypothetical protein